MLSYELRTPLANIQLSLGVLETLLHHAGLVSPDTRVSRTDAKRIERCLQIAQKECQLVISNISDLLMLQELVHGNYLVRSDIIQLRNWLEEFTQSCQGQIGDRHQILAVDISADLLSMSGDPFLLKKLLWALLANISKLSSEGAEICFAAKYSFPPASSPSASSSPSPTNLCIEIRSSGLQVSCDELLPALKLDDPIFWDETWKTSGITSGLALIEKLTTLIEGDLQIIREPMCTGFALRLPLKIKHSLN